MSKKSKNIMAEGSIPEGVPGLILLRQSPFSGLGWARISRGTFVNLHTGIVARFRVGAVAREATANLYSPGGDTRPYYTMHGERALALREALVDAVTDSASELSSDYSDMGAQVADEIDAGEFDEE